MLKDAGADYQYREYTEQPLSLAELELLFGKLAETPRELLRKRDASGLGLSGNESDAELLGLMAKHPTLLQRPILVSEDMAVVGRPVEALQALLEA